MCIFCYQGGINRNLCLSQDSILSTVSFNKIQSGHLIYTQVEKQVSVAEHTFCMWKVSRFCPPHLQAKQFQVNRARKRHMPLILEICACLNRWDWTRWTCETESFLHWLFCIYHGICRLMQHFAFRIKSCQQAVPCRFSAAFVGLPLVYLTWTAGIAHW